MVNLLVRRKADAASQNKSGKSAADLARDPAIKELLNKAVVDAFKPQELPVRSDTGNAEQSGEQGTASLTDPNSTNAENVVEIGPQEQLARILQDGSVAVASLDNSKHFTSDLHTAPKGSKSHRHQDQTDDSAPQRPSKVQKIALSFAEDDDES